MAIASPSRTGRDKALLWQIFRTDRETGLIEVVGAFRGSTGLAVSRQVHAMYSENWLIENWNRYDWQGITANTDILPIPLDEPGT